MTFLCEKGDSVAAYEARGTQRQYTHDAGMDALSSGLSHVQHVEMVHGELTVLLLCVNVSYA